MEKRMDSRLTLLTAHRSRFFDAARNVDAPWAHGGDGRSHVARVEAARERHATFTRERSCKRVAPGLARSARESGRIRRRVEKDVLSTEKARTHDVGLGPYGDGLVRMGQKRREKIRAFIAVKLQAMKSRVGLELDKVSGGHVGHDPDDERSGPDRGDDGASESGVDATLRAGYKIESEGVCTERDAKFGVAHRRDAAELRANA